MKKSELEGINRPMGVRKACNRCSENAKSELEKAKYELEQATREGDYARVSKIQYASIPELRQDPRVE